MRADLLPGIGGHRVERELGAGGMGQVFLCRDEALDRLVAIKVLLPELLEQEEMRTRFLREARALAKVSSPHVVAVHAVGEDAVVGPFVVMEYLDGEDLHARLTRDRKIPWREAVKITRDAVLGLVAAENAGIVHRDIKPANLFVVGGKAKLTDFGLAREVQGAATVTQAGIVVGTPAYLAPEVIRGSPASHQSDLYSLCATLHHLIAGLPPFPAEAPLECLAQAVMNPPPPLRTIVDDVPEALERCVLRGLAKKPEERQQGWAALDVELAAVLAETSPTSTTPGTSATRTLPFGVPSLLESLEASGPASTPGSSGASSGASLSEVPTMQMQLGGTFVEPAPSRLPSPGEVSSPSIRIKTAALTVMMTDIAGYTERTSRVSREESARWLALHDALLQPVFRSFGGKVVKTLGDAFLVTFSSPTDATLCACAVQDRLWHHNREVARPEDAIHVRVALSAGEVRLHKGDIFGEPVNLAARLEALAQPGEVLVSDAVYSTMNTSEVRLVSRGEHALKGISRAVTVWAAQPDGIDGAPPFGGRALAKVNSSVVDSFKANAPLALESLRRVGGSIPPRVAMAGGGVLALALVVALIVGAGDDRLERIERGEARSVIEDLEKIPEAEREGEDLAIAGHARWKLENKQRALDLYRRAVDKGYVDDRMKGVALSLLAVKDADAGIALLTKWPDNAIDKELHALLEGEEFLTRTHALEILEARKAVDDDARIELGFKNLASDNCHERREGVKLLKKHAKGTEALSSLKKLGTDPLRNACLIFDLPSAEDAVRKRTAE